VTVKFSSLSTLYLFAVVSSVLLGFGCGGSSSNNTSLTGIDIAPISPSVAVGSQEQFMATAHFSNGPDQNVTANATWTSSATNIATIDNLGTTPGSATAVSVGSTVITASFVQGSSTVSSSTDLTVTAKSGQASWQPEGMAAVSFVSAPGVSINGIKVDGRVYRDRAALPLELAAGLHRFVSLDGRYTLATILQGQHTYSFEILPGGRIVFTEDYGASR